MDSRGGAGGRWFNPDGSSKYDSGNRGQRDGGSRGYNSPRSSDAGHHGGGGGRGRGGRGGYGGGGGGGGYRAPRSDWHGERPSDRAGVSTWRGAKMPYFLRAQKVKDGMDVTALERQLRAAGLNAKLKIMDDGEPRFQVFGDDADALDELVVECVPYFHTVRVCRSTDERPAPYISTAIRKLDARFYMAAGVLPWRETSRGIEVLVAVQQYELDEGSYDATNLLGGQRRAEDSTPAATATRRAWLEAAGPLGVLENNFKEQLQAALEEVPIADEQKVDITRLSLPAEKPFVVFLSGEYIAFVVPAAKYFPEDVVEKFEAVRSASEAKLDENARDTKELRWEPLAAICSAKEHASLTFKAFPVIKELGGATYQCAGTTGAQELMHFLQTD